MKTLAGLLLFGVTLVSAAGNGLPSETVDLVLDGHPQRLRLQLVVEGTPPQTLWSAFLDRWFDFFDRNADGVLDRAEAARVFPLPVPGQTEAAFQFDKADANRDGKVTSAELKAFYLRAGFAPVMTVVRPPSLQDVQVAEALFRHFGPDANGRLTAAKLQRAGNLLRKLDENEDEVLTVAEVLSLGSRATKTPERSDCRWVPTNSEPAATIRLVLGRAGGQPLRVETADKSLQTAPASGNANQRVRARDVVLAFAAARADPGKAVAVSRQFVLAQFESVAGDKQWVQKRHVEDDASLQLLADLFPHADRDADGKLTRAELDRFLALIEQGVSCSLVVTLMDQGRNLFELLDTNGDGRLDYSELRAAIGLLSEKSGPKGRLQSEIPRHARVVLQRGVVGSAFGPVPLAAVPTGSVPGAVNNPVRGPAWFRAMDRNGDGFVSRSEFLGPLELFQRLDLNGDGRISVEEAERALPPAVKN